ncbi:hypothetical protein KSF_091750 [Reticulibacter mediterranei]|uniref:Uncharacterized protein n=1 Tax=Reticulibacter mediterranei TaxID=2778369 RepID=A0A8J3N5C5_9CHLR|nr:hypothetical protein KSF_091750 [Reticulibacter mediterranei]
MRLLSGGNGVPASQCGDDDAYLTVSDQCFAIAAELTAEYLRIEAKLMSQLYL